MSAALMLLVLIGLAATVWSACFVGCSLNVAGTLSDYYQYQSTIQGTPGLVAFWPLDDASGTVAVDAGPNNFNGTYTVGPDVTTYSGDSDASPGTFTLNQANIVVGDTVSMNGGPAATNPCVYFNGGYVSVPWQAALSPPAPAKFTLEAWVVPNWTLADAQANPSVRAVAGAAPALGTPAVYSGFLLFASAANLWSAAVGIGAQDVIVATGNNQTIVQGSLYFLVMTYDGSTLTLWVNPADTTQPPDGTAAASGYVPIPSPVPFYIGQGRPDLPTPRYPFNGSIQDVAFYNVVLDGKTIEQHYLNGSGMQMS